MLGVIGLYTALVDTPMIFIGGFFDIITHRGKNMIKGYKRHNFDIRVNITYCLMIMANTTPGSVNHLIVPDEATMPLNW